MPITKQTVYSNGKFSVVALVTLLAVEIEGRRLHTFGVEEIEDAVSTADTLAERDGCMGHCTA